MDSPRYRFQQVTLAGFYDIIGTRLNIDPPTGYRMQSWRETEENVLLICWERESTTALAQHIPSEWVIPALEWAKRLIVR